MILGVVQMYNNGMPASYDSWRLASPPEPDYDDYEEMIKEKMKDVVKVCENICEEADPECEFENSFEIFEMIKVLERRVGELKNLAEEIDELENEQDSRPRGDW